MSVFLNAINRLRNGDPYAPSGDPNAPVNNEGWGSGGDPTSSWSQQSSPAPVVSNPSAANFSSSDPYGPAVSDAASKLESAYAVPHASMARQALGGLFVHHPGIGAAISGEGPRNQAIQQAQNEYELANDVAQKAGQRAVLQNQLQQVDIPGYGPMSPALAKVMFPAQIKGAAEVGSAQIGAQSRQAVAATNKRFIPVSGVGVVDTQDPSGQPAVIPGSQQGITITPEIAKDYQMPDQFVGKPMKLSDLASFQRGQDFQNTIAEGAAGPALVNRRSGVVSSLGLGNPSLGHAVQVGDPNNPGETMYTTAGQAINTGAQGTQSASVQVPKTAMKAAVPTNIGNQTVAFNTAIQHAQLLRQAAQALQNGDVRTLNSISNAAKSQFGDPDLTNFDAIANAYNHEVTNVIGKGHLTDAEVRTGGATMPSNANYATIDKVLNSYQQLMQSKMNMMNNQTRAAVGASQTHGATNADPLGIR